MQLLKSNFREAMIFSGGKSSSDFIFSGAKILYTAKNQFFYCFESMIVLIFIAMVCTELEIDIYGALQYSMLM